MKIKENIKKIIPLFYLPEIILLTFISIIFKNKYDQNWLICERGDEAKDNGYYFFKYIIENNLNERTYFLISKDSKDKDKLKNYDNVVSYRSLKHKILYILSECSISTHHNSIIPWKYCDYKAFKQIYSKLIRKKIYVFLQHGIIKDDVSDYLGKKNTDFDLFICGAKKEFEYVKDNFGYDTEVVYTGLARFDNLHEFSQKKQIVLMPTWRHYLSGLDSNEFMKSDYYRAFQLLINNEKLIAELEENNIDLIFYPHYEIQKHLNAFNSSSKNIVFASKDKYDVQILLKESALLITDYSSVFFDFAYMKKPIIYFQFDADKFKLNHYKKGYFEYEKDGFGDIEVDESCIVENIINNLKNDFKLKNIYKARIEQFFELRDKKNCSRIYKEIIDILNK